MPNARSPQSFTVPVPLTSARIISASIYVDGSLFFFVDHHAFNIIVFG